MKILFFCPETEPHGELILTPLSHVLPRERIERCGTVDGLSAILKHPSERHPFAILIPHTSDQLHELVSIGERLFTIRSILLLPDESKETISLSHLLRPRILLSQHMNPIDYEIILQNVCKKWLYYEYQQY